MKNSATIFFRATFLSILVSGCLEPYTPPTSELNPDYLVVDAFLNATAGSVTVSLHRTIPLSSSDHGKPENDATVLLKDDDGTTYHLQAETDGLYLAYLAASTGKKYKLVIRTAAGKDYESDLININTTPDIDSINYFIDDYQELNINVNTHDPEGDSRFYRWDYEQTFEYRSQYASNYIMKADNQVLLREPSEHVHLCWKTDRATRIIVGTSKLLTRDIITNHNLAKFQKGSLEMSRRYSILVKQQTLTEEAYRYWYNIQKTTESLGGLFDPLPSEVTGNIRCVSDPKEPVIGYFSGSTISEKRIFIDINDLPSDFTYHEYDYCEVDSILLADLGNMSPSMLLLNGIYPPGALRPTGYTAVSSQCADCRSVGGVLTKPEFWN